MYKRFAVQTIVITLLLLGAAGVFIWIVDPFVFYHTPFFDMKITYQEQEYQNPGLMKNLDYETIIMGSSMTENFRASEVEKVFDTSTIKICKSGSYSMDIASLLECAVKEKKAKQIILGFDTNILRKPYEGYRSELPDYLYNENPFDDTSYLLNKTVLFEKCYNTLQNKVDYLDDFYIKDINMFSKETALQSYDRGVGEKYPAKEDFAKWASYNIENIVPIIADNPQISFKIFIPPYSILFWDRDVINDCVEERLDTHKMLLESLLQLENVEVYYFMNDYEVITNLDNYLDAGHYSPSVCSAMLTKMYNGEYRVTKDNYEEVLEQMRAFIYSYDYESIFVQE